VTIFRTDLSRPTDRGKEAKKATMDGISSATDKSQQLWTRHADEATQVRQTDATRTTPSREQTEAAMARAYEQAAELSARNPVPLAALLAMASPATGGAERGISGYGSTDEILRRTMEESGDHDPTKILAATGKPLHFDALDSAAARRAGEVSDGAAWQNAKDTAIDHVRDQVIEKVAHCGARVAGPAVAGLGPIAGAVVGLGAMYKSAIEDSARKGEAQRALGASDAGVVALAQVLEMEPGFRSYVTQAHTGSGGVAAAMAAKLADPEHAGMRTELALRADRGLVDAAGYAQMAATATLPLLEQARGKFAEARAATDPSRAAALRAEGEELNARAVEMQSKYLAPVLALAHGDAAYGLGVQRAVYLAASGGLDVAADKARANLRPVAPTSITVQG
jgi:hypothetical protein